MHTHDAGENGTVGAVEVKGPERRGGEQESEEAAHRGLHEKKHFSKTTYWEKGRG